ncbi:uncharacterized protein LOC142985781 [Anticarsia gemmatalis]|uniref:uncharacterized protein LOC142985781 n=1 Tax=Anticarsia gemmatalis TaxID=129554 RepID=UPI003F76029A
MLSTTKRTPPNTPTTHYASQPNLLSTSKDGSAINDMNVTLRKRKRGDEENWAHMENLMKDMKEMFSEFVLKQTAQSDKMDSLQLALEEIQAQNTVIRMQNSEIRTQNNEIQKTIAFLSAKYDDALVEINSLKVECSKSEKRIKELDAKIDLLERQQKAASIEIKNLPLSVPETRQSLSDTIQKLAQIVNNPVTPSEIKNIFRYKSKSNTVGTVLVEFTSTVVKEQFLKSTKDFNKVNTENRLNTTHLLNKGSKMAIYVNEVLTTMTRRLHYLAREMTRECQFHQCWIANGKVYIREQDGKPSRLIRSEEDLVKLRKKD